MRFLPLIVRNLLRRKLRALLTVGSFAAALLLFGLLAVIGRALAQGVEVAGADRLVVRNRVSLIMPLPLAHRQPLLATDGVTDVTFAVWFGAVYKDERNFFPQYAIDAETWRDVYPEYRIPDEQWQAFLGDREGCVIGHDLSERFGFEIGDRIPLQSPIFGGTWEFNVRGIYDGERPEDPTSDMWIRYDYLDERREMMKGVVGWYVVRIADPARADEIAAAIDRHFRNSPWETSTQTEQAFLAGFANQIGNIRLILLSVGAVVFFTLILVSGNTMAMSVRERRSELAVLRTLGFPTLGLILLVGVEAMVLGAGGAAVGLGLAKLITLGGDPTGGLLPIFYLAPREIAAGLLAAVTVATTAGAMPTALALRRPLASTLREA